MEKPKKIIILIIGSLIPLIFTATIPYVIPVRLDMNSTKSNDHSWTGEIKLYVVSLEEGMQYTIDVDIDDFWGMDTSIRIGATPYMINGFSAHADQSDLLAWMAKFEKLDKVFLIHGERDKQAIFKQAIEEQLHKTTHIVEYGEEVYF